MPLKREGGRIQQQPPEDPPKEQLEHRFDMNLFVSEVPMSDWRCGIASDIAEDLFATYSKQAEQIVSHVMVEQQSRFIEVMKSISHCCGVEDMGVDDNTGETKVKKRKKGRDTVVGVPSRFIAEMALDQARGKEDPREKLKRLRAELAARAAAAPAP
jgi:hypothetical protein